MRKQSALAFVCLFALASQPAARAADDPVRLPIAAAGTIMTNISGTLGDYRVVEDPVSHKPTMLVTLQGADGTSVPAVLRVPCNIDGLIYPANEPLPPRVFGHPVTLRVWKRTGSNGPALVIDEIATDYWSGEMYSVPSTPPPHGNILGAVHVVVSNSSLPSSRTQMP